MTETTKPRIVGINHVALEVGDIEEALDFYGSIFSFELRGRAKDMAFLDMGDQFLALMKCTTAASTKPQRHFGLAVDDRSSVRERVEAAGGRLLEGSFLDFLDPWNNRIQVVEYRDIQFTKSHAVLRSMGLDLAKSDKVRDELENKGIDASA